MTHVLIGTLKKSMRTDGARKLMLSFDLEEDARIINVTPWEYMKAMEEVNPQLTVSVENKYQFDDDGNEYWIGRDGKRHYTRDEG